MKTFSEEYLEHADLPEPDDGGGDGEEREDSAQQDADLPLQLRVLVPLLLALGSLLLRAQSASTHQALGPAPHLGLLVLLGGVAGVDLVAGPGAGPGAALLLLRPRVRAGLNVHAVVEPSLPPKQQELRQDIRKIKNI